MKQLLSRHRLFKQNLAFKATGGVSDGNQSSGFVPAFFDTQTGTADVARFIDGSPAPFHLLDGVPDEWVVARDPTGRVAAVKDTVIAGFLHNGSFFTREQAARVVAH